MARVVVFIASSAEMKKSSIPATLGPHKISVCYTGLGKVRATAAAYQQLTQSSFDLAINLGTCGSHRFEVGTLVEAMSFVERDVDLSAVGIPVGFFPGAEGKIVSQKKYLKNLPSAICGTGDRIDLVPPRVDCDIYDMEAFALAFVCKKLSVPLVVIKFISDSSVENVGTQWKENLIRGQESLLTQWHEIMNHLP